ncbi:glycosyltransferase family 4 protein [Candidatus Woesearchaeota archaeon]|nr:glycosyltransferase family 4 protein [Candidatus Woesearchaeota archaeon]
MNYLLLTEYFPESEQAELTGGVECRCFHLVKQLAKAHEVVVLCSHQPGQPRVSKIMGAKIIRCGPSMLYSGKGNLIKRFMFSYALYSVGKRLSNNQSFNFSPDIVEGACFITYPSAYFLGKRFNAKKVATWHETWIGEWVKNKGWFTGLFGEIWERLALKLNWDKIICVSNFTKKQLVEKKVRCKNIEVIPNGINLKQLNNITSSKEKYPTICYFGRLNWQKNLPILIKALLIIKKEIPKVKCRIIGTGPAENGLKELVQNLGLQDEVTFSGYIKNYQELLSQAKACHVFVSPSTLEGFGITVIEAMALRLPYVITDISPFLEITRNGKGGEIFQQMNVKDLAQKVVKLLTNKKEYLQKLEEGKLLIEEYDWKKITKNYLPEKKPL